MAKTYAQILEEVAALQAKAEALRKTEVAGVIGRIKEAIATYGLTAEDLGFSGGARGKRLGAKRVAKAEIQVKYRDEHGNVWGGRGPRPLWLREQIAKGRALDEFAV